jgi:hypothetical protein
MHVGSCGLSGLMGFAPDRVIGRFRFGDEAVPGRAKRTARLRTWRSCERRPRRSRLDSGGVRCGDALLVLDRLDRISARRSGGRKAPEIPVGLWALQERESACLPWSLEAPNIETRLAIAFGVVTCNSLAWPTCIMEIQGRIGPSRTSTDSRYNLMFDRDTSRGSYRGNPGGEL